MKFKVGDKVKIINEGYRKGEYAIVINKHIEGRVYIEHLDKKGNLDGEHTYYKPESLELIEDMNQEIVGYELLKDLPGIPAGTKSENFIGPVDTFYYNFISSNKKFNSLQKKEQVLDTTWFKPIYKEVKPTEVFVDTLAGKVKVTNSSIGFKDNEVISHLHFNNVAKAIKKVSNTKDTGWNLHVETFSLGCKKFAIKDIPKIEKAIKQVS